MTRARTHSTGITTAAGLGADVVEVDARRSRDGIAMLLHDPLLLRVQHLPLHVRWLRSAQLARVGIPTLAEALETAREAGVRLAVDTKDAGAADAVLAAVRETGAIEQVLLWSQHMPVVRTYVRALPDAEVALLRDTFEPAAHDRLLADAAAIGARAVSAHQDVVTPAFIGAAARARTRRLLLVPATRGAAGPPGRGGRGGTGRCRHRLARRCPSNALAPRD